MYTGMYGVAMLTCPACHHPLQLLSAEEPAPVVPLERQRVDVLELLQVTGMQTPKSAAMMLSDTETPSRAQIERARRRLDTLVRNGQATVRPGRIGGPGGGTGALYVPAKARKARPPIGSIA